MEIINRPQIACPDTNARAPGTQAMRSVLRSIIICTCFKLLLKDDRGNQCRHQDLFFHLPLKQEKEREREELRM